MCPYLKDRVSIKIQIEKLFVHLIKDIVNVVKYKGSCFVFSKLKRCRSGCGQQKRRIIIGWIKHTPPQSNFKSNRKGFTDHSKSQKSTRIIGRRIEETSLLDKLRKKKT